MLNLVPKSTKLEIIKHLFAMLEAGPSDPIKASDEFVNFFTEDALFRIGNPDARVGRQEIWHSVVAFCRQVKLIQHDIKQMWEPEENVAILDMEVTYRRLDNRVVTLPVMDFFRFKGNLIQELRIFMDVNPLFA